MKSDLELIHQWRLSKDIASRNELVMRYRGAIVNLSGRYPLRYATERKDLVHEGVIGVILAIDKFDESRGTAFWTLARFYVRDAMYNYVLKATGVNYNQAATSTTFRQSVFKGEYGQNCLYNPNLDRREADLVLNEVIQEENIRRLNEVVATLCTERQQRALRYTLAYKGEKGQIGGVLGAVQMKRAYNQAYKILEDNLS